MVICEPVCTGVPAFKQQILFRNFRSQEPRQQIFVPRNVVAVFREFSACSQERFPGIIPYELLWKSVGQGRSKRIAAFPVVAGVSQHF